MIDRAALRLAYRVDEEVCSEQRIEEAASANRLHEQSRLLAGRLIEIARAGKPSGIDAFLQKPFEMDVLLEQVRQVLA